MFACWERWRLGERNVWEPREAVPWPSPRAWVQVPDLDVLFQRPARRRPSLGLCTPPSRPGPLIFPRVSRSPGAWPLSKDPGTA